MKVIAYNIVYDTDGIKILEAMLPKEITFTHFTDLDEVEAEIADAITDETGFCVFSCEYKVE